MNHFLKSTLNCTNDTKYSRWYASIIDKAVARNLTRKEAKARYGYAESHHIMPKSLRLGGYRDKENIVMLSPKEHFVCHLLLARMDFGFEINKRLRYALFCMMNQLSEGRSYRFSSTLYSTAKQEFSENQSLHHWTQTPEGRRRISERQKGRPANNAVREAASKRWKSVPKTEEHRRKISYSNKGVSKTKTETWLDAASSGRFNWAASTICERCGGSFKSITFKRYHGEKCGMPVQRMIWWHDPLTGKRTRVHENSQPPLGYVRGKGSFNRPREDDTSR